MAGSEQGMNKVRSILGKMDRSISDARKRRLGEPEGPASSGHEEDDLLIGHSETAERPAQQEPAKTEEVSPMRARYGKARPIGQPSSNGNGTANGTGNGTPNGAGSPHHDGDNPLNFHARPA